MSRQQRSTHLNKLVEFGDYLMFLNCNAGRFMSAGINYMRLIVWHLFIFIFRVSKKYI